MNSKSFFESETFIEKAQALRPFYFIVVCWGKRYSDFLLNYCIAALLSPNNIPALRNQGKNKFLIATTDEDWDYMQSSPIFKLLSGYVEPIKILISLPPNDLSPCIHMGLGHKLATQMAFNANAYAVLLTPDLMVSDGTMAAVQRRAVENYHLFLVAALRFAEEPLFKHLQDIHEENLKSQSSERVCPISLSGRQMVSAGIKSFHSETLTYEWDAPYFSRFPVACWWKSIKGDGILVHSLSWAPLMIDYAAIKKHDTSTMDNWTIDGDYVYKNFGNSENVYVCKDSDECMLISWAPWDDKKISTQPRKLLLNKFLSLWIKKVTLYDTFHNKVFDPLKQKLFYIPVYWHANDLDHEWNSLEKKAAAIIESSVGTKVRILQKSNFSISAIRYNLNYFVKELCFLIARASLRINWFFRYYWEGKGRITMVIIKALSGDPVARKRISQHYYFFMNFMFGKDLKKK